MWLFKSYLQIIQLLQQTEYRNSVCRGVSQEYFPFLSLWLLSTFISDWGFLRRKEVSARYDVWLLTADWEWECWAERDESELPSTGRLKTGACGEGPGTGRLLPCTTTRPTMSPAWTSAWTTGGFSAHCSLLSWYPGWCRARDGRTSLSSLSRSSSSPRSDVLMSSGSPGLTLYFPPGVSDIPALLTFLVTRRSFTVSWAPALMRERAATYWMTGWEEGWGEGCMTHSGELYLCRGRLV